MPGHVDILEEHESLKAPIVFSAVLHAGLFTAIIVYTNVGLHGAILWGTPNALGGGSVGITSVRQLPLPARAGEQNPLASDTESRVPQPPKPEPKKARARVSDEEAIPLKGRSKPERSRYERAQSYRTQPDRPNQLYSGVGQALSSNMYGGSTGTGGVGVGPRSAFGYRWGWYRDLLEQRVAQKWHTEDVDQRFQSAPPVIVTFDILRNGSIRNVRILQGSGNRTLDSSAQRAIYDAAPFPELPRDFDRDSAQIEFWFQLKR